VASIRQPWHNRLTWAAFGGFVLAAAMAPAQEPAKWKTGPAFRQQLDEPVGIAWQERALRDGLDRLSQTYGVAIFLDRRIDPGRSITLTARDEPLETLLRRVATLADGGTAVIGSVVYLGPRETASQLAALAAIRRQDAARLSNDAKARLLRAEAWQWEELAQPRQLVEELARRADVSVVNPEAIPLDLWPAVRLPPLAWTDRLTLLLAGFGLTFEIDGGGTAVRLVPQPAAVALAQDHAPRSPSGRAAKGAKGNSEKLYSMQVANEPAGKVVRKVSESLGKDLKYDRQILEKLKQPVTFKLENATLDYLLETTLKPLGLTHRLTDDALEIVERQ
jgi:hypothetical protein